MSRINFCCPRKQAIYLRLTHGTTKLGDTGETDVCCYERRRTRVFNRLLSKELVIKMTLVVTVGGLFTASQFKGP